MPPGPGGGGGYQGGGKRRPAARERQGNEEIRKFLNFYKRRNSLCVDLYLPAFFQKKPSYEDLAEFVYSVLSVGGTSPPQVIRAAVQDIQLHPVKKLLFIKFTEQHLRDEVVARLQGGLVWPAFDSTVTGWAMDKPMERIRVLGTSPETNEAELRQILGQYGEILEAQKGLISQKLPGCTNGIWTVKMFVFEGKSLPPFLIMKDEGEVWQLANGEASVCWKCGQEGHIGDKCRQAVNVLAESLASPAVGVQPSWAHVVKGGVSVVPTPPPAPPRPQPQPITIAISRAILRAAKSALKETQLLAASSSVKLGKVVTTVAKASEVPELSTSPQVQVMLVDVEDVFNDDGKVCEGSNTSVKKKPKLSEPIASPGSPKPMTDLASSPSELPHKVPGSGSRKGEDSSVNMVGDHSNLFGINFIMWFDVSIEKRSTDEEDWGGRINFGFDDNKFPKDLEDFFLMMEDECSSQSCHSCVGRVMGVLCGMRDKVVKPPSYDPRKIDDMLDKYRDGHILDMGWREVDEEEWFESS